MTELGSCCVCEGTTAVRSVMFLSKRSPYNVGWGCFQCGLPMEGAIAVLCDVCIEPPTTAQERLRFFCGPDASGNNDLGRFPIRELAAMPLWEHALDQHPELQEDVEDGDEAADDDDDDEEEWDEDDEEEVRCAECGCTEFAACPGGCYWVDDGSMRNICSQCYAKAGA